MNVSACLVTRGDVDMQPVLDSLPPEWEKIVWDNSGKIAINGKRLWGVTAGDISVYGRYAAIEYASHDLIYVADDDCIVSDPSLIVEQWECVLSNTPQMDSRGDFVVCNMPERFRHDFYSDHSLVGFGAAFHRAAFDRAMLRFANGNAEAAAILAGSRGAEELAFWRRTCDIVFTGLTPRVLVDVPHEDREMASDPNRMWKQPQHVAERTRMLELVRAVKSG